MGKAEFLYNSAVSLPITTRSYQLLKSYYLTRSRLSILARSPEQTTLNTKFSNENICDKCSTLRSDGQFSIKIDPIKCKGKSKRNKLQQRIKYDGDGDHKTTSSTDGISIRNLKRYCNNTAKIKCSICNGIAKVNIFVKSKALLPPSSGNNSNLKKSKITCRDVDNLPSKKQIPNKKLKKDKTSGLKIPKEITSNTPIFIDNTPNKSNNKSATELMKLKDNTINDTVVIKINNTNKMNPSINNNQFKPIERKPKLIPKKQNLIKSKLKNKPPQKNNNLRLLAIALKEKSNSIKKENFALATLLTKNN